MKECAIFLWDILIKTALVRLHLSLQTPWIISQDGVRTADSECGTGILATDRICRCIVQWRRIYASDHCTKKYRPDGSIIVDEPGICICCTGGMGHFRRKTFRQRICGMRTGILSSDSCPAPGTESSQFRKSDSFRINCRVAEYAPNA